MSEPAKKNALTRLIEEEDATAAVEFMVLVPVYILLLTALFMFGNLVLARYTVVHGTRYVAWHPDTNSLGNNFPAITPYPGTLQINGRGGSDVTFNDVTLQGRERSRVGNAAGLGRAQSKAEQIAKTVINNERGTGKQMKLHEAEGSFQYGGVSIGGMQITQSGAKAAVYLPSRYERKEYQSGQSHPATEWGGSTVDVTKRDQGFFSPKFQGHFDKEDGVWDPKARIKGSWKQELDFYKPQVR